MSAREVSSSGRRPKPSTSTHDSVVNASPTSCGAAPARERARSQGWLLPGVLPPGPRLQDDGEEVTVAREAGEVEDVPGEERDHVDPRELHQALPRRTAPHRAGDGGGDQLVRAGGRRSTVDAQLSLHATPGGGGGGGGGAPPGGGGAPRPGGGGGGCGLAGRGEAILF
jgi:hypothetical protein